MLTAGLLNSEETIWGTLYINWTALIYITFNMLMHIHESNLEKQSSYSEVDCVFVYGMHEVSIGFKVVSETF